VNYINGNIVDSSVGTKADVEAVVRSMAPVNSEVELELVA